MARKRFRNFEQGAKHNPRRDEVIGAGQDITSRYEPAVPQRPAPGVVEPPQRVRPDRTGKVAAIIATLVLVAGVVGLGVIVTSLRNRVPIEIESVTESVDATNGCEWQLAIELRNRSDEPLSVNRIRAILNRGLRTGSLQEAPLLAPGETGTHLVSFRLLTSDGCPAVDEINHGNLIFNLADGSSESLRF